MNIWAPFYTLFLREIKRFLKVIVQTVVTPFVSSLLYLVVFGVSLGNSIQTSKSFSYLAFLIPGLVMMALLNGAFQNTSSSIVVAKFNGELEDFKTLPFLEEQIVWAMSFAAVVRGLVVGLITYIVGAVFLYFQSGEILWFEHPLWFLFFAVVGGLVFGQIGIAVAFWARSMDQLSAFSAFILLPLTYLGGVFISISHLHPFWQKVAKLNPVLYFISGARYGILGESDVGIWTPFFVSLMGLLIFYFIALISLRRGSYHRW